MPDYAKGNRGTYQALRDRLEIAKQNAARGLDEAQANGTDNPTTCVHMLVHYLQSIKGSP